MTEVRLAAATLHLNAAHAMRIIGQVDNTVWFEGLEKAGPATRAGKLGTRLKEWIATNGTVVGSFFVSFPVFARESVFSTFFAGYVIHLSGKYFFPFCVVYVEASSVGTRIVGIVAMVHFAIVLCVGALCQYGKAAQCE